MVPFKLEEIRSRCEALQTALAEEYYESAAGLKNESNLSRIYERHGEAVSREAIDFVRAKLALGERPAGKTAAPERTAGGIFLAAEVPAPEETAGAAAGAADGAPSPEERRRLAYLLEFQIQEFTGKEVRGLSDEVLTRESAANITLSAGAREEEIPFRRAQLDIANSKDRDRRESLERASLAVIEELTPLFAERIGIERGIARSFGFESTAALWQETARIDLATLDRLMQGFLARTADMYKEAMGWVVRKRLGIPLEDAKRHDLLAIFRGAEFDDHFRKDAMVEVAARFLGEMGVDATAGGNVTFDLEPRERKSARAFSAVIDVPGRIVLVVSPEGGRRDWQRFLHELGRALHAGYTSRAEPYEYRRLGDSSLSETTAFLLQYLLIDRGWLKRNALMQKPKAFLFLANLEKLTYLRRYAAKLHYELELHGREDGIDGRDALYEDAMFGALRVRYPRELFLYDVDRDFYSARYLRAWLFEALLSKHLVHYFDEDWHRNPRTGAFLRKHWALGQRYSVDEMAREIGYAGLDTAPLEEEIAKAL